MSEHDDTEEVAQAAKRFIDECPEAAEVVVFDKESVGFLVKWSLPGVGVGELSFAYVKCADSWTIDDEQVGAEVLARVFAIAFPQGGTTALDHQNIGCAVTSQKLLEAFDLIDQGEAAVGVFGNADMNTLIERYRQAKKSP